MICLRFIAFSPLYILSISGSIIPIPGPDEDNTTVKYNMDDRLVPSAYQKSYPLTGLRCFPNGVRLACDCEKQHICPCCEDYEHNECYKPTFHEWSVWQHCDMYNELCDETNECRIKYDEVTPRSWLDTPKFRKRRGVDTDPQHWSDSNGCQVQRAECRLRRHGEWGSWSEASLCSSECFVGTLRRVRECLDKETNETFPLELCPGGEDAATEDTLECNTDACVTASQWVNTGRCFDNDGQCDINQTRTCAYPSNVILPEDCSTQTAPCPLNCSLLGKSGYKFGSWSGCNSTCYPGYEWRIGHCVYLIDDFPSMECEHPTVTQYQECDTNLCREYTDWQNSSCSDSCNGGMLQSNRTCLGDSITPHGCTSKMLPCNEHVCTVLILITIETGNVDDAGTSASVSLLLKGDIRDAGFRFDSAEYSVYFNRLMVFTESFTVPEIGNLQSIVIGHDNTGSNPSWYLEDVEITVGAALYEFPCGAWFDSEIGDGKISRTLFPGEQCHQENFFYVWTEWSECSEACSQGLQFRNGTCRDNATGEISDKCEGEGLPYLAEERPCNTDYCADEDWDVWSQWSACSAACGSGNETRARNCSTVFNAAPAYCSEEKQPCTLAPCVAPGPWGPYGVCNSTCSPGMESRTRQCFQLGTSIPATGCTENLIEYQACDTHLCNQYSAFTAADLTKCHADRNGSTCTARMYDSARDCTGGGTVPTGCLDATGLCGTDARPGGNYLSDVSLALENDYDLDEIAHEDCAPGIQTERLTQVKDFIYRFMCSYNTFEDVSKSRISVADTTTPLTAIVKPFSNSDLFSSVDGISRICRANQLMNWFLQYQSITKRSGVKKILIIFLSYRDDARLDSEVVTLTPIFSALLMSLQDAKYGMISTFNVTGDSVQKLNKFVCGDKLLTGSCPNYLGTIWDDVEGIIEKITSLWI